MVCFVPGEHDVRSPRGEYLYYVRVMKRGSSAVGRWDTLPAESLLLLPLFAVADRVWSRVQRNLPWKIVVLRGAAPSSWADQRMSVVACREIPAEADPVPIVGEMVAAVEAGAFDGERGRSHDGRVRGG